MLEPGTAAAALAAGFVVPAASLRFCSSWFNVASTFVTVLLSVGDAAAPLLAPVAPVAVALVAALAAVLATVLALVSSRISESIKLAIEAPLAPLEDTAPLAAVVLEAAPLAVVAADPAVLED